MSEYYSEELAFFSKNAFAGEELDVIIYFDASNEEIEFGDSNRKSAVVEKLKKVSLSSQDAFFEELVDIGYAESIGEFRSKTEVCWLSNSIKMKMPNYLIGSILIERPDQLGIFYSDLPRGVSFKRELKKEIDLTSSTCKVKLPSEAWHLTKIGADKVWKHYGTGEGELCAIIDEGFDFNVEDFIGQIWQGDEKTPPMGKNFNPAFGESAIDQGANVPHGTACASLIVGNGQNGLRTGIAPGASVLFLTVFEDEFAFCSAIAYAIEAGANVISCSVNFDWEQSSTRWNPEKRRSVFRRLFEWVNHTGTFFVNSVGNKGLVEFPSDCPSPKINETWKPSKSFLDDKRKPSGVFSVGNTLESDYISLSTGNGPVIWNNSEYLDYPNRELGLVKPDLMAPGTKVWVSRPIETVSGCKYFYVTGSSYSAPIVAGALCILISFYRQYLKTKDIVLDTNFFLAILESTAVKIHPNKLKNNKTGSGRIDLYAACEQLELRLEEIYNG